MISHISFQKLEINLILPVCCSPFSDQLYVKYDNLPVRNMVIDALQSELRRLWKERAAGRTPDTDSTEEAELHWDLKILKHQLMKLYKQQGEQQQTKITEFFRQLDILEKKSASGTMQILHLRKTTQLLRTPLLIVI